MTIKLALSDSALQERREKIFAMAMPEPNSGCWLWMGRTLPRGYGQLGSNDYAHRMSYEVFVGPIPLGLEIDHKCRVTCCVNPNHLEPVTHAENVKRGHTGIVRRKLMAARTHCLHGHLLDEANTYTDSLGWRHCRKCNLAAQARRREKRR